MPPNENSNNYWNRETSAPKSFSDTSPIIKEARIVIIAFSEDDANKRLYNNDLPEGASVVAVGSHLSDFDLEKLKTLKPNVIFICDGAPKEVVTALLDPSSGFSIEWIHSRSVGIDFITSPTLSDAASNGSVQVTNAKGCYSSTLAEYTMMAIGYFAKDLPRLLKNKGSKNWEKYCVEEIRGKTLGIVGYGDIGKAAARLAKAYGMKILALKRKPLTDEDGKIKNGGDGLCDEIYYGSTPEQRQESLYKVMEESDYILCAAPLTPETHKMFNKDVFAHAKPNSVFMNVGRGPTVDEDALIAALKDDSHPLKGAGLDVFETEPLPVESEMWDLENVLISAHNMDQTETFQHESSDFFLEENLPRFLRGDVLLNPVDAKAGY